MTKVQATVTPEELYNLTQLAEVTLAAGRLSTTNVTEIKDYIKSKQCFDLTEDDLQNVPRKNSKPNRHLETDVRAENKSFNQFRELTSNNDLSTMSCGRIHGNETVSCSNSSCSSSCDIAFKAAKPTSVLVVATKIKTEEYHNDDKPYANPISYSSSDDDCNYYSHKVFDRKKFRRSTVSDNSPRYDEHSCSSSIPSCSGDEQHQQKHSIGENAMASNTLDQFHTLGSGRSSISLLDDDHSCPECGKKYSTSSNLARHRQTHRSIMDKKARRCPYCEKVYVSMPAFSMHVRTHNQGCECQFCGKCFSRPWLLQGHIRTHTGEKPFKCSVCDKAFADKSNLRAHIQTHSNVKPHTCARCGKAFALKSYLYKHEESSCMKNNQRSERESRHHTRVTIAAVPLKTESKAAPHLAATSNQNGKTAKCFAPMPGGVDSAKSTLATKLLQKEKERRQAALVYASSSIAPASSGLLSPQPSASTAVGVGHIDSDTVTRNLQFITMAAARLHDAATNFSQTPNDTAQSEKSYTMLTNTMSQEEYERFKHISVIQPNLTTLNGDEFSDSIIAGTSPPPPSIASASTTTMHFYERKPPDISRTMQEEPVDFSPKNNFTHSSKTSPFELTGKYAMVA